MRNIANAVGIRAASIYSHYKSKEILFLDIFECYVKDYNINVNTEIKFLELSSKEKLLYILNIKLTFFNENPNALKFLARNVYFPPEELKEKLQTIFLEENDVSYIKTYHEIYDDLKLNYHIKNKITLNNFISSFQRVFIGYAMQNIGLNYYEKKERLEDIFELYWEGIKYE